MTVTLPDQALTDVLGFLLVVCRVGGLFVLAPGFSATMIPNPPRKRMMPSGVGALSSPCPRRRIFSDTHSGCRQPTTAIPVTRSCNQV